MDQYRWIKNPKFKRLALRVGIVLLAAGAFKTNQNMWQQKMKRQGQEFAAAKQKYEKRIHELELQAGVFRFYEHHPSGARYEDLKAIDDKKFVNARINPYKAYTTKELNYKLVESSDSLTDSIGVKIADSWSFEDIRLKNKELREKMAASIEDNDGEAFLQQSSEFMKLNLAGLAKLNRRHPHLVKTAVERSDEENEREAMIMFHVIQTKFKSKYYVSKKQYWRDAVKIYAAESVTNYRNAAQAANEMADYLTRTVYRRQVREDSLAFEAQKQASRDSLFQEAKKVKLPVLKLQQFVPGKGY